MKKLCLALLVSFLCIPAHAAETPSTPAAVVQPEPAAPAAVTDTPAKKRAAKRYEIPTMQNLSKLYWKLSFLDLQNDTYIDNFMLINKCDVYRDYFHNEFQWKSIREKARDVIAKDQKSYPTRFQFMQPVKLGHYDTSKNAFDVLPKYKINPTTRFELLSTDAEAIICDYQQGGSVAEIEGYPRSVIVEFSRPFSLDTVPVDSRIAEEYIKMTKESFNGLKVKEQNEDFLYDLRDAYLVMNVRVIIPKSPEYITLSNKKVAELFGVLESIKIYADPEGTLLLSEKKFVR